MDLCSVAKNIPLFVLSFELLLLTLKLFDVTFVLGLFEGTSSMDDNDLLLSREYSSASSVPGGRVDRLLSTVKSEDQWSYTGTCYFHLPDTTWSFSYYVHDGAAYFYVYLWILKDFSWAQNHYFSAHFFGGCALLWQLGFLVHSVRLRSIESIWINVVFSLWLGGWTLLLDVWRIT